MTIYIMLIIIWDFSFEIPLVEKGQDFRFVKHLNSTLPLQLLHLELDPYILINNLNHSESQKHCYLSQSGVNEMETHFHLFI